MVTVPDGMCGKDIMKLNKQRLRSMCNGSSIVGDALFVALREESRNASKEALENRRRIKGGASKRKSAAGYACAAPAQPLAASEV
mgnify:FL=1